MATIIGTRQLQDSTARHPSGKVDLSRHHQLLLTRPISKLTPPFSESGFQHFFEKLNHELARVRLNDITIEPYFGDEWFCPDQTTAIAVPFWLANDDLRTIEKKFMGYAEGETEAEFMRLLRHEAGHCVDHAYGLSRLKDWRDIFGNPRRKYDPDAIRTIAHHPDFVENLPGGYAQTHPLEDFAETFAVWLHPSENCFIKFERRPVAIKKIEYIGQLMRRITTGQQPIKIKTKKNQKICNARRMRRTLAAYYKTRLNEQNIFCDPISSRQRIDALNAYLQ